jgi:hypothetical protein
MDEIVKFALETHHVEAKWRIIPLADDQWKKLSIERASRDKWGLELGDEMRKLVEKGEIKDEELKRKISEAFGMEKEIEKEYGRVLTLEDHLNSNALFLMTKESGSKGLKRLRGKFPFLYRLSKRNRDKDFVILLNANLISRDSRREKLKTVVHETLHFVQDLRQTRTCSETIENEADTIINKFDMSKLENT